MSKASMSFRRLTAFAAPLNVRIASIGRAHGVCHAAVSPPKAIETTTLTPGVLDEMRGFRSGPSVLFWHDLNSYADDALQRLVADLRNDVMRDRRALPYYTYCLGRSIYFSIQGLVSLQLERMRSTSRASGRLTTELRPNMHFVEAGYVFRDDWQRISAGVHRAPWDASLRHRQFSPVHMMSSAARFLLSSRHTLAKRKTAAEAATGKGAAPDTSVWLESPEFPAYYKRTFHFQQDGWLSASSANVYEVSTETLFIGRQDAMQRLALEGMREYAQGALDIVEVGAGTGRLATFILDSLPLARYTLCDLSPFYLAKARENVSYWRRFQNAPPRHVRYIQSAAENLPLPDASADVVLAVYLLHEMPTEARRRVAREASRVLRPGGSFILVDSVQLGDRPIRDAGLDNFEKFNEPWFPSYIREDFGSMFAEFGLQAHRKEISSVTKLLTFKKTQDEDSEQNMANLEDDK